MIKYNTKNINEWYFDASDLIKVYRNGAVVFYKVSSGGTPTFDVCYAVVDDISQYQETEFEDVFDKATDKWYKLNNLNQYEEYGVYGSGRTITYYEGKLTVDEETTSRLPSGYTEVEYIERTSVHNGYVGLGEYFQENTKIEIDFQMTQAKGNAIIGDYGSNDNDDWRIFLNYDVSVNNWLVYDFINSRNYNNTGDWSKRFHIEVGNYYVKDVDSGNYLINATKKTSFTRPNQMYLFHMEGTQSANNIDYGKIYSLKIWQNDTLVKEFVACYRNSDNVVGLYDIVGNTFHGSLASTLVAGSAVTPPSTTYEYIYSGSSWVNVGEVSGSTATLPNVPFSVNYNAKNYNANTQTLTKTSGQLVDIDAVITAGTPTANNGYLTISDGTIATISGYQTYFNRNNDNPNITIISKQMTDNDNCHLFANRDNDYNWMYRCYSNHLTLHGSSEQGELAVTTQPVIESVRVDSNRTATYNNYTDNTSYVYDSLFEYGGTNSGDFAMFAGYANGSGEWFVGNFYWIYMSQNTLTDAQIQQVIDYNEGSGGTQTYPLNYEEKSAPLDDLSFSSMTEATEYAYNNCVYDGMKATIDGSRYYFDSDEGWVYNPQKLPSGYTEVEYITSEHMSLTLNTGPYINTNYYPTDKTRVVIDYQATSSTAEHRRLFGAGHCCQNNIAYVLNMEQKYTASNREFTYRCGSGNTWVHTNIPFDLERHVADFNNDGVIYLDNTQIGTRQNAPFTATYPMYLLTDNNDGSIGTNQYIVGRVYSCQMYENGTKIRDFVPAKRDSDSKYGLYDIVNNNFYPSSSNYQFSGGTEV